MPIIMLSPTQRLISTQRSWEWQILATRKHRETGEPIDDWRFYRNYTSLERALNDVANTWIRVSEHEDIRLAIQEVKNALAEVCNALTQHIKQEVVEISAKSNE
jgi:hypothetical protein